MRFWLAFAALLALVTPAAAQSVCPSKSHTAKTITGTSYTIGGDDICRTLVFTYSTPASNVAITVPYVTTLGNGYNFWTKVYMEGGGAIAGVLTPSAPPVSGSAPTINGSTTLTVTPGKNVTLYFATDGNWYATGGN